MKKSQGGQRPNAGRPYIDGATPGQGRRAVSRTITLTAEQWQFLADLGDGNASAGVRALIDRLSKSA